MQAVGATYNKLEAFLKIVEAQQKDAAGKKTETGSVNTIKDAGTSEKKIMADTKHVGRIKGTNEKVAVVYPNYSGDSNRTCNKNCKIRRRRPRRFNENY